MKETLIALVLVCIAVAVLEGILPEDGRDIGTMLSLTVILSLLAFMTAFDGFEIPVAEALEYDKNENYITTEAYRSAVLNFASENGKSPEDAEVKTDYEGNVTVELNMPYDYDLKTLLENEFKCGVTFVEN